MTAVELRQTQNGKHKPPSTTLKGVSTTFQTCLFSPLKLYPPFQNPPFHSQISARTLIYSHKTLYYILIAFNIDMRN
ncbi:hypothetical protein Enr10x_60600 [Gimesia panareensis]|uniref:Uncharacterized protein n=1 Tax=Gimesia panareensis TaxID=2527978 RepID=A0A517QGD6_9PLAN|nr:hypothetical protein Enr10x_60600 [Gimesia panareensis]